MDLLHFCRWKCYFFFFTSSFLSFFFKLFIFVCGYHCGLTFDWTGHWPITSGFWTILCTHRILHDVSSIFVQQKNEVALVKLTSIFPPRLWLAPLKIKHNSHDLFTENLNVGCLKMPLQNIYNVLLYKWNQKCSRQLVWINYWMKMVANFFVTLSNKSSSVVVRSDKKGFRRERSA